MIKLNVLTETSVVGKKWVKDLQKLLSGMNDIFVMSEKSSTQDDKGKIGIPGEIILVDSKYPELVEFISKINRSSQYIAIVVEADAPVPSLLLENKVDGVVSTPFRIHDIYGKIREYDRMKAWNEVAILNGSISGVMSSLNEDLEFVQKMQKRLAPKRFSEVKGLQVESQFFTGMRSGGDYFDLAESKDGKYSTFVLSTSSSYGLSAAVLSALMRVAVKCSVDQVTPPGAATLCMGSIFDEISPLLKENDKLSFLYGTFSRKDSNFYFLNLGYSAVYVSQPDEEFREIKPQGGAMTRTSGFAPQAETVLQLMPGSRVVLISQGFIAEMGGSTEVQRTLQKFRFKDMADCLNEWAFKVKEKLGKRDSMPEADCTVVAFEVSKFGFGIDPKVVELS